MERDFLALVRDRVNARLVDSLSEEIALGIVASEETEQVVIDVTLKSADVDGLVSQPTFQLLDLGRFRSIHACSCDPRLEGCQLLLKLGLVGSLVFAEGSRDLRKQVLLEELRYLGAAGVHYSVNSEVQVRLVKLKQFEQQRLDSVELGFVDLGSHTVLFIY